MKDIQHIRDNILSELDEQKIVDSIDDNYLLSFSDIETYNPAVNPKFWYGGFRDLGVNKECRVHNTIDDYLDDFLDMQDKKRKVIYFFNSSYDMSIIQHYLITKRNFKLNPIKPCLNAIYGSNKELSWEIYTNDIENGIIVLDSQKILSNSIRSWGSSMGFEKGDTPIIDEYREPTTEDINYLVRDIEILYYASMSFNVVTSTMSNKLTSASVAQSSFRDILAEKDDKKRRNNTIRFKHSRKRHNVIDYAPRPKQFNDTLERLTDDFKATRIKVSDDKDNITFGITKRTVEKYKEKLKRSLYRQAQKQTDLKNLQKRWADVRNIIYVIEKNYTIEINVNTDVKIDKDINYYKRKLERLTNEIRDITFDINEDELPNKDKLIKEDIDFNIQSNVNKAIQSSLRGGISYVNPNYKAKVVSNVATLDVNSLYPFIITNNEIPNKFVGASKHWDRSKYYVMQIKTLKATLKEHRHPFLKRNTRFVADKEYLKEIDWLGHHKNGVWDSCLCSVDVEWLYRNYDVHELTYENIYYFEAEENFNQSIIDYIEHWRSVKENAKNANIRKYAKMHLNSLWGRWAMYEKVVKDAGKEIDVGDKDTELISAIFTTAYSRVYLNSMMNLLDEDLIYTDTDSVHFVIGNKFKDVDDVFNKLNDILDENIFGAWAFESYSDVGKYLKPKTYIHENVRDAKTLEIIDKLEVKSAGASLKTYKEMNMTKEEAIEVFKSKKANKKTSSDLIAENVNVDNFNLGQIFFKNKSHLDDEDKIVICIETHKL